MNQPITADQTNTTRQLTMIGLMTAVTCILGPLSIPLPFSPVPITLTNFAVFLSIYILGMKHGTISLLIYLALGTIGLPVFSSFSGGLGKLAGPTGGYLFGFIFLALIHGFFMQRFPKKTLASVIGMSLGMTVCYLFGTIWLAVQMNLTFTAALAIGVLPYLIGDAAKIILAAIIGPKLANTIQKIQK
ncbi:biotin transporter BioY [Mediterraneibacter sp.]|jgi:biotin transport system substrate-specific component|uniref:biotin transporter BioY n=1 Tax=Mediterraneibacter sp. TaxID=2316022 RepID=UPI0027B99908|nr:biotin transporter BioY [Mediterraneibacter sp.]